MQIRRDPSGAQAERGLVVIAASALALLGYGSDLSYGLTDLDTMMNIAAARVETFSDLGSVVSARLTGGRADQDANFYRPTLMLLFAGVRGLFDWTAAAYHGVNIALHAICAVLAVAFARAAATRFGLARPRAFSLWAGLVFVLHPVGIEVVPAVARAGDLLVTVFFLAGMLQADRYLSSCPTEVRAANAAALRHASLFCVFATLALTSKEPSIALFAAAPLYLLFARHNAPAIRRITEVGILMTPALAAALLFLFIRTDVLGEFLGGYHLDNSTWDMARPVANFLPVGLIAPGFPGAVEHALPFYGRLSLLESPALGYGIAACALALLGLVGWRGWRSRSAGSAARREDAQLAARIGRDSQHPSLRVAVFALCVIGAFGLLFTTTATYDRRLLYPVLPFFSLLLALLFDAAHAEVVRIRQVVREEGGALRFGGRSIALLGLAVFAAVTLAAQSPLYANDREWREAGRAAHLLTEGLRESWQRLPAGSRVWIVNLPGGFDFDPHRRIQYTERSSTNALSVAGIQAWLDDQLPSRALLARSLGTYRYQEPLQTFRHNARIQDGWLEFDEPLARTDVDRVSAARRGFRLRDLGQGRFALA